MFKHEYDNTNSKDIERHAKQLENHCLNDYLQFFKGDFVSYPSSNKGRLGILIESILFNYKPNSTQGADFKDAGVELKVTPLKPKGKAFTIKERLVLGLINFNEVTNEDWNNNSLIFKLKCILLMFYLHEKKDPLDLTFKLVSLWKPSSADLNEIKKDWQFIVDKIKSGNAHKLSEGDTNYLGACPKGKNSRDTTKQPFSNQMAMRRAFSLKSSYMRLVYQSLLNQEEHLVSISKDGNFEAKIKSTFKKYIGNSLEYFIHDNNLQTERTAKQFNKNIVDEFLEQMLGGASNQLEEFNKANITLKTILLQKNGIPKESMSFKQIQYQEIVNEDWDDFEINKIYQDGRFLWVVFKAERPFIKQSELALSDIIIEKIMFWNMPYEDLQIHYKELWEDTKVKITRGDYNNFITSKDNPVGHIRPKGKNAQDLMITPQGTQEKKKCFWINARYIAEQIKIKN